MKITCNRILLEKFWLNFSLHVDFFFSIEKIMNLFKNPNVLERNYHCKVLGSGMWNSFQDSLVREYHCSISLLQEWGKKYLILILEEILLCKVFLQQQNNTLEQGQWSMSFVSGPLRILRWGDRYLIKRYLTRASDSVSGCCGS